jgi:hypothetical protein
LFVPNSTLTFLLGEGNFGRGNIYIPSDLGFVLGIYGYGIIGVTGVLIILVSVAYGVFRASSDDNTRVIALLLTATLILVNFKDYYLFYPIGHYTLFFTFLLYLKRSKNDYVSR